MIGILSYGLGNVRAFESLYRRANVDVRVVAEPAQLAGVSALVLPGVGAFDHAMDLFDASGLRDPVEEAVRGDRRVPVLGVCVGMQILASSSDEGVRKGLDWISGRVLRLNGAPRVPHLGWNDVEVSQSSELFDGLVDPRFYFLHSYYFEADCDDVVLACASYGERFTCAVRSGNVMGVQFHPEKSHDWGKQLLLNFARVTAPC